MCGATDQNSQALFGVTRITAPIALQAGRNHRGTNYMVKPFHVHIFNSVSSSETTTFAAQLAREKTSIPNGNNHFPAHEFSVVFAVRFMECRSMICCFFLFHWFCFTQKRGTSLWTRLLLGKCTLPYFWYELFSKKKQENAPKVALNVFFAF